MLQEALYFTPIEYHGYDKIAIHMRLIWPSSLFGILPDVRQCYLYCGMAVVFRRDAFILPGLSVGMEISHMQKSVVFSPTHGTGRHGNTFDFKRPLAML